jgi:diguanylate cyclase (GGDEF)-like protein
LDDVLKQILTVINDTFGYTNCAILLIDKKKNKLYIKAAHGYSAYVTKSILLDIRTNQGITSHVAATGKMLYAPDVFKVPFYVMGKRSVRSEAAIPLKIRDEVIGVLDIESDKLNAFSEKDLRMFSLFAIQAAIAIENARLYDETKILSLTDGLTKIANRRHFDLTVESEVRKARGYSRSISLAMIDLDNFKNFNDRYGHQAGDRMLINIARILKESVRDTDFVARYGGEEFVIVFPETGNDAAIRVSERIRRAVEVDGVYVKGLGKKCTTVSLGVATYPYNAQDVAELVYNADKALYRAKQLGKNRVETLMPSIISKFPELADNGPRRR